MAGLKDLVKKYTQLAATLPAERQKLALIYAKDAHAITTSRIQNEGKDSKGVQMQKYSNRPFNLGKLNPSDFNAPSKITKFKKDAAKGKNNGSYRALRDAYGLTTAIRTLTFDGNMFKSIEQVVTYHDELRTEVTIRANDEKNQKKVDSNSSIVGSNILAFGVDEKTFLNQLNKERIEKYLK